MSLSIGISPCPNDTFIFDALLNNEIFKSKYNWELHLEDVETLNDWAMNGKMDVTKMSFATYFQVKDKYDLLNAGSALGRGVGPLLVSNKSNTSEAEINNSKIGIPGLHTTANLLFSLAFPNAQNKVVMPFQNMEDAVIDGTLDLGLVIHESRFTYQQKGLFKVMDMGEWWEEKFNLPIPLGCICIKKELSDLWKVSLENDIQKSIQYSKSAYPQLSGFIKENAQEMDPSVMIQHIDLYVNDDTYSLNKEAYKAIHALGKASIKI